LESIHNVKFMPERKKVDPKVEAFVLSQSARRCCMCFHLRNDLGEKLGQIAHLDHDPGNGCEENLAYLCMDHHSMYDSRTSQHKNYTSTEVKDARAKLYEKIADRKPIEWWLVLDGKFSTFDRARVEAVLQHLKTILEDSHITIKGIDSGSVRLLIESAQDTYEKMRQMVRTGELTTLLDEYPILEVDRAPGEDPAIMHTFPPAVGIEETDDADKDEEEPEFVSSGVPARLLEAGPWFDRFFVTLRPRLIHYFHNRGMSLEMAEDLAEETFLRFLSPSQHEDWSKEGQPEDAARLLYSSAQKVLRKISRKGRHREVSLSEVLPNVFRHEPLELPIESRAALQLALRELRPAERAIVTFRLLGWSSQEIAEALNISIASANARYVRALAKLRDALVEQRGRREE
jgi:RNA polymerase sigma factor (sigma-70 family)